MPRFVNRAVPGRRRRHSGTDRSGAPRWPGLHAGPIGPDHDGAGGRAGRLRAALRHRVLARRAGAVAVAAAVAFGPGRLSGRDGQQVGSAPPAPVAVGDLAPGTVVGDDDIRWVPVAGDVVRAGDPTGSVVVAPVADGEIIAPSHLGSGRLGLTGGDRAVLIPAASGQLPLVVGDVVELIAVRTASDGWGEATARGGVVTSRLGATGRVVALGDDGVVVAVPGDVAREIVAAQALGTVTPVLTPWTG